MSPEIIKQNNPGLSDFGVGTLMALSSQCLRCAKVPTECEICLELCPKDALAVGTTGRPHTTTDCIKCGACVGVCPLNALAGSSKTVQSINRLVLTASLRVEHLAITCERTSALLRLAKLTEHPKKAERALKLIDDAAASDHLLKIPCIGMLPAELWFSFLNEIGVSKLEELSVFLPSGQCATCPVNAKDSIEDQFSTAIGQAETWTGQTVGILTTSEELPQTRKANVRAYLVGDFEVDRRGAFTGFVKELKQSWEENAQVGNKALAEVQLQRERKASFERTRLSADIKNKIRPGKTPIITPVRYAFMEALGRNDAHAGEIVLRVSDTDNERCTLCGTCVDACPVHARCILDAEGKAPATAEDKPLSTADASVATNPLYCVACSACLQACPEGACGFSEVVASDFLFEELPEA
ncbi:MAG: 4Fe-4S binding protein [Coriobacteriales bacterium]|nr:4Fe-4S binding protein [Coriobacteriales bacterium]